MGIRANRCVALSAAAAVLFLVGAAPGAQASSTNCSKVAAPGGSDGNAGTINAPVRSASRLVDLLGPGQVGCLRGGSYSEPEVKVDVPGVTLTSYGSERAALTARLFVSANNVNVSDMNLIGTNAGDLPSPTITGDGVVFARNDVTNNHTAICFALGSPTHGRATGTVIDGNKIHNCGRLPAANHDHGIYVELATGTVIKKNWIYDNADRGIQLYPDADQTTITGNVIDGNGQGIIFGGDSANTADGNVVERNVISNSVVRYNVESYYDPGDPIGSGNVVRQNCVSGPAGWYGGADGGGITREMKGFVANDNLVQAPSFVNRAARNFTLTPGSPCARILDASLTVGIKLRAGRNKIRPNQVLPVSGETTGATSGAEVALSISSGGKWVQVGSARVRSDGTFSGKVRVRASRKLKVAKLQAGIRGMGSSNPVKVKLKRSR